MSYAYELPALENHIAIDYRRTSPTRLTVGLKMMTRNHDVESHRHKDTYASQRARRSDEPLSDDEWDLERLNPSTCHLKYAHLVCDGVPTGQKSIAQETGPANA